MSYICQKCGSIAEYNAYYGRITCTSCGWQSEKISQTERIGTMVKVGDKYVLHSKNGMDYNIEVVNINDFREPSMKYGIDVYDRNGTYAGDVVFVDDDFLNQCERLIR